MGVKWGAAQQGSSGLWFKPGTDDRGRRHLLAAETRSGVDGGSHDHYWDNGDGTYGVQLRDQTGCASVLDGKGHIYPQNTTFPSLINSYLRDLFERFG